MDREPLVNESANVDVYSTFQSPVTIQSANVHLGAGDVNQSQPEESSVARGVSECCESCRTMSTKTKMCIFGTPLLLLIIVLLVYFINQALALSALKNAFGNFGNLVNNFPTSPGFLDSNEQFNNSFRANTTIPVPIQWENQPERES